MITDRIFRSFEAMIHRDNAKEDTAIFESETERCASLNALRAWRREAFPFCHTCWEYSGGRDVCYFCDSRKVKDD